MFELLAARYGFIEKCAAQGIHDVECVAFAMALAECKGEFDKYSATRDMPPVETSNISPSRPEYEGGNTLFMEDRFTPREKEIKDEPLEKDAQLGRAEVDPYRPTKRKSAYRTWAKNIPYKYGGGLMGGLMGAGLGSAIGKSFDSPWLGALLGAGGLGLLGHLKGQDWLAAKFPDIFATTEAKGI